MFNDSKTKTLIGSVLQLQLTKCIILTTIVLLTASNNNASKSSKSLAVLDKYMVMTLSVVASCKELLRAAMIGLEQELVVGVSEDSSD